MQRSTERILTTHVGSLARPHDLLEVMREKEHGRPYDPARFTEMVTEAVARRGAPAGRGRPGRRHRRRAWARSPSSPTSRSGWPGSTRSRARRLLPPSWQREIDDFPEYYATPTCRSTSRRSAPMKTMVCTGPVAYSGQAAAADRHRQPARRARRADGRPVEAFLPSTSPSGFGRNDYYASEQDYLAAVAEALREEYLAIVECGLPAAGRRPVADRDPDRRRPQRPGRAAAAGRRAARRGAQPRAARHPGRTGSGCTPATASTTARACTTSRFRDVAPLMLQINAGAYSFEVANPRHQHEWRIWARRAAARGQDPACPGCSGTRPTTSSTPS